MDTHEAVERRLPFRGIDPALEGLIRLMEGKERDDANRHQARCQHGPQPNPPRHGTRTTIHRQSREAQGQKEVGGIVPAIDYPQRPQGHSHSERDRGNPSNPASPQPSHEAHREPKEQQGERDDHHVSMKVGE